MGKLSIAEESLENSLNSLELILVIYFGALIVMEEQLSVGMLIAFLAYRSQFTSSIFSLIDKLITFKLIGLHLDRLSDITFEETENDNGSVILPHSVQGHIKVSNLWFRYSDNTDWIPTSHLDSDNEKTINVNINQLKITKVVIAHRKETIRSANRIINITPDSMT
jgi:ATP-binding cassette subfamily B protein RaxB